MIYYLCPTHIRKCCTMQRRRARQDCPVPIFGLLSHCLDLSGENVHRPRRERRVGVLAVSHTVYRIRTSEVNLQRFKIKSTYSFFLFSLWKGYGVGITWTHDTTPIKKYCRSSPTADPETVGCSKATSTSMQLRLVWDARCVLSVIYR